MSTIIEGVGGTRRDVGVLPGLHVTIGSGVPTRTGARRAMHIDVRGGTSPVRLYLYVDGELAEAWVPISRVCEYATETLAPGRHALTARAIDAEGRWGGTTVIVDGPAIPAPRMLPR